MTKEMYAAQTKNWLMDLATGVKAMQKEMQFAPEVEGRKWRVTASCFDTMKDGLPVHNIRKIADTINVPIKFGTFEPDDFLYGKYPGYCYVEMFGVRFYDYIMEDEL